MSDEQKESSVLFSLKELINLEEDRVNQEKVARQQEEARRRREREEQERRAREAEEAARAAEVERQRQEEQRQREEQARLEAIRAAEIERQRVEAQQRAHLEAQQQQLAHAQQLERIRQDEGKKKLRLIAGGAAGLFVLASIIGVTVVINLQDQAKADEVARVAATKKTEAEQARQRAEYQKALADIAALQEQLKKTTNDVERQKLEKQLKEMNQRVPQVPKRNPTSPTAAPGPGKDNCPPGSMDPMCG